MKVPKKLFSRVNRDLVFSNAESGLKLALYSLLVSISKQNQSVLAYFTYVE